MYIYTFHIYSNIYRYIYISYRYQVYRVCTGPYSLDMRIFLIYPPWHKARNVMLIHTHHFPPAPGPITLFSGETRRQILPNCAFVHSIAFTRGFARGCPRGLNFHPYHNPVNLLLLLYIRCSWILMWIWISPRSASSISRDSYILML